MAPLAKRLRAKALDRLGRLPNFLLAYRHRNRWSPAVRFAASAGWLLAAGLVTAYALAAILGGTVFVGSVLALGPLPFHNCNDCPAKGIPIFAGSALATHGWVAAVVVAIAVATARNELFFPAASLKWLAYTPHDDAWAARQGRWNRWFAIGLFMAWQAAVLGWVAHHEQAGAFDWAIIAPLAAVQAAVAYSCVLVAITLLRSERSISEATALALPLLGYGYFALWISQFFPQWTPAIARQLLTVFGWLLPTGWIDALYWHGVLGGQAWGWLFLLPCAAIVAAAIGCRRWPLGLREFRISPQGDCTPILVDDPEPADAQLPSRQRPAHGPAAAPRQQVLKRLLERRLGGGDWSSGSFIERWIGSRLSPRERSIVECLLGERPNWTAGWCVGLIALSSITAIVLLLSLAARSEKNRTGLVMLQMASCGIVVVFSHVHFPRDWRGQSISFTALPLLPLGFREVLLTSLKVAAWRLVFLLPVLATALLFSGLCLGRPAELITAGLAVAIGATFTLALVEPVFRFGSRTLYQFSVHRCAYLLVMGILFVASQALILNPFWQLTTAIAAGMPALALVGAIHYDWLHHTGRVDYQVSPAMHRAQSRIAR